MFYSPSSEELKLSDRKISNNKRKGSGIAIVSHQKFVDA